MEALSEKLSPEEIEIIEKECERLATEHKCGKVHACVQVYKTKNNERVISYIQEPNYPTQLYLLDKAAELGAHQASENMREMCIIKEASHPLTYIDTVEANKFKVGVVRFCMNLIKVVNDELKKN
jgi:hypothetical protein